METSDPLSVYSDEAINRALDRLIEDIEAMPDPEEEEPERWDFCQ